MPAVKMAACLPSRHGSSSPAGGAIPRASLPPSLSPSRDATARRASRFPTPETTSRPGPARSGSLPPPPSSMAEPPTPEPSGREVRDRLCLWDRRPQPAAPLSDRQTDSVLELKAAAENLPVPAEVRRRGPEGRREEGAGLPRRLAARPGPTGYRPARPPLFPVLGCFYVLGLFFFFDNNVSLAWKGLAYKMSKLQQGGSLRMLPCLRREGAKRLRSLPALSRGGFVFDEDQGAVPQNPQNWRSAGVRKLRITKGKGGKAIPS